MATRRDPVEVAPHIYKVLMENERVRVMDVRMKPGAMSPLHSHPAVVGITLAGGKLKVMYADREPMVVDSQPGSVLWLDPQTHSVENVGATETHDVVVELKGSTAKQAKRRERPKSRRTRRSASTRRARGR